MTQPASRATARPAPERPRRGLTVAFRALAWTQAALALLQAVLAGQLLSGNIGARDWHNVLGSDVMVAVAALLVVAAALLWRPGRGPAWPLAAAVVLGVLLKAQMSWGFGGRLALHVPGGTALLAGHLLLACAPLRPALGRWARSRHER